MKAKAKIGIKLIAPCGMNCGICMAYLRDKNRCPGCRIWSSNKAKTVRRCIIINCTKREGKYCFSCQTFPCARLKQLDKRYRTKYAMSMLENLASIREKGIRAFIKNEVKRWACPECGGLICVHKKCCFNCAKINKGGIQS